MSSSEHYKKIVEGIPFFSEDRYMPDYWKRTPKAELEQALKFLEEKGWDEFKNRYKNKFDLTFEENRADWRFVLPLPKDFTVLDAGAGMGRITIPLARVAKKVTALDQSFHRVKFLKARAENEGLNNVEVFVGDFFDATFTPESFDLIVMNGLLEWIGTTDRFSNPREAQLESLRIAKKWLKKGGILYIGIENRFALSYLRGKDHSGLYYTSYLPRFLANAYSKMRLGKPYDTYTYTHRGYEKLIKEGGFGDVSFYLPHPGYNVPRIMIPYENINAFSYLIRSVMSSGSLKKKAARLLGSSNFILRIYRHFFFSFGIVIRK